MIIVSLYVLCDWLGISSSCTLPLAQSAGIVDVVYHNLDCQSPLVAEARRQPSCVASVTDTFSHLSIEKSFECAFYARLPVFINESLTKATFLWLT